MANRTPVSPVIRFIRSIEGEYLTLAEIARTLRVPESTLRTWRRLHPETFNPSTMTYYGQMPIYLYSLDDLERIRVAIAEHRQTQGRTGRPRRWSVPEQQDRQRRQSNEYYARQRARRADAAGNRKEAARYRGLAKELRRGLDRQLRERERALR